MLQRVIASSARRAFHAGRAQQLAVHTVNVPSMGDSISEGTLVQVVKAAGDAVHADEVVAVLETDKVSVDVMSPVSGTIVEHFAKLEDNVVVGAMLFSVDDSRAPAAGSKPSSSTPAATPAAAPAAATPAVEATASSGHRTPLIKFLGKRSLMPHTPSPAALPSSSPALNSKPSTALLPSSADVLPFHRAKKIPLTTAEVDAINSGISFL